MPTLAQLIGAETDPTVTIFSPSVAIVEPLDGPTSIEAVMDRFPEEVYQRGRDTHLYRFLQALGGDAGAGLLKKLTFAARLRFEAEFLNFQVLDDFYASQFRFQRLLPETYTFHVDVDALTPTQWDQVQLADASYKHRLGDFFTATRYGNSPTGLALMAQAALGIEVELVEHYHYIFDQYNDDPLGLEAEGTTISTSEFVIIPRGLFATEDVFNQSFEQTHARFFAFEPPDLDTSARPIPLPDEEFRFRVGSQPRYFDEPQTRLLPELERNAMELLDRLRPATTFATVKPEDTRYIDVPISGTVDASSERFRTSRLVTGRGDVPWPDREPHGNFFIVGGEEHEAGHYYGSERAQPVTFHTVESVHAYTDRALSDPLYGPNEFYDAESGLSAYASYISEHYGGFPGTLVAIFPFLASISIDVAFVAENAVASANTPLVLEGRAS